LRGRERPPAPHAPTTHSRTGSGEIHLSKVARL
jgi:hypothetical protein